MVRVNQNKTGYKATRDDKTTGPNLGSTVSPNARSSIKTSKNTQNIYTSESTRSSAHRSDQALRQSHIEAKSKGAKFSQSTRVPLARVSNTSKTEPILVTRSATDQGYISELVVINQDEKELAESFAAMGLTPSDACSQTHQSSLGFSISESCNVSSTEIPCFIEPSPPKSEYVSLFLHCFTERIIPSNLGVSLDSLEEWVKDVLHIVAEPSSEQAKRLLKETPQAVLFAQQLHLANQWSEQIEDIAQRAASRDYYYDFLIRMYGHTRARQWITGREGDGRRRRCAQKGSLSMRKRVLIGQGYKAYHESMVRQAHLGTTEA